MRAFFGLLLSLGLAGTLPAARTLDVYFVDVEGGQATLFVAPSGQSMLVDSGWPGFNGRDAARIAAAAKAADVKKIDYMVTTHYHTDHVGGLTQLLDKLPVVNFVDHGPTVETNKGSLELYATYEGAAAKGKRIRVKPGDSIPLKGVDVKVVTANGEITGPLPQAGAKNPLCGSEARRADDPGENARSVGVLVTFNKFRIVDLGDLTWNKELELACPETRVPPVDVYLSTHHGMNMSGPAAIVHSLKPRVAIINNGARKGGTPEAWKVIRSSPGLEDLWQLHFAVAGGKDHNSPDSFIANPEENCEGKWLKLSVDANGAFTVSNARNKYQKTYPAR
jgi:beta-lactamase superfamily II metal-dependent hydrolase